MKYSQDFYDGKYTVNIYMNFNQINSIDIVHNLVNMKSYVFSLTVGGVERNPVIHSHPRLGRYNVKQAYELVNVMQEALSLANAENLTLDMLVSLGYSKADE